MYEAYSLCMQTLSLQIIFTFTFVVYSNGIQNVKTILETGINQYNVKAVSMFDKDGDIVIQEVEEKLNNNIAII